MSSPEIAHPGDAKRKRATKIFEHASKLMSQEKYDFDYVTDLLTQCVLTDPSNKSFVESYLNNLKKKYNNNKKGASMAWFQGGGARGAMKKVVTQVTDGGKKTLTAQELEDFIKHGLTILKINPWDIPALCSMATVAGVAGHGESELLYLKSAKDSNPKDADVNRQIAMALDRRATMLSERAVAQGNRGELDTARKLFDQAISCWRVVEQAFPENEEPKRHMGSLGVKKSHFENEFKKAREGEFAETKKAKAAADTAEKAQDAAAEITPEQKLKLKIAREPKEVANYLELAELYIGDESYKKAEEILAQAYKVSGNNTDIRDKWEDAQIRALRHQVVEVRKRAQEGDEQAKTEYKRLRKELNDRELAVCVARVERYPTNLIYKYDLGVKYRTLARYQEAIRELQQARSDPRRKGVCMLELGQCFTQVKQYGLAMRHYQSAVEEIPDRDADNKKLALYLAGKLALGLHDLEMAERHLTNLAGMDFVYKDVSALLDKIAQLRDNNSEQGKPPEKPPEQKPSEGAPPAAEP